MIGNETSAADCFVHVCLTFVDNNSAKFNIQFYRKCMWVDWFPSF